MKIPGSFSVFFRICFFFALSTGTVYSVQAQQKYWIYLREKNPVTEKNDLEQRLDHLRTHGVQPVVVSQWLEAVSALLTDSAVARLSGYPCIAGIIPIDHRIRINSLLDSTDADLSLALSQIHGEAMMNAGYTGKGVKIGLIDAGFMHANRNKSLQKIISEGRMLGYQNFIEKDQQEPYDAPADHNDSHGARVWTYIAGNRDDDNSFTGLATNAQFYLARTDQSDHEYRGEEDYWIAAVEWMHDQGVRLINSSLGYSTGFDDPDHNYSPDEADGETSVISRFANMAVREKGMILIMSAGNDGNKSFKVVNIPADAKEVVAVGATEITPWTRQNYSSTGREWQSFVKPDVACFSGDGTSFSAPVITGLAACIMEARPDLTNREVIQMIKDSGHLADYPNNYLGSGVPDAGKIIAMINDKKPKNISRAVHVKDFISLEISGHYPVIYHKKGEYEVVKEEKGRVKRGRIDLKKPDGVIRTTIVTSTECIEVFWDN